MAAAAASAASWAGSSPATRGLGRALFAEQGPERPVAPRSHGGMPQDIFDRAGSVALDIGQQLVAPAGLAGLRVTHPAGGVHDPPDQEQVLAVLHPSECPDRRCAATARGQRGQGLGGDLVGGETHARPARREAATSASTVSRM